VTAEDPKLIVAVYLRGEHLDPEMVTQSICIQPSRTQKKGQTYITQAGREFTGKLGLWALVVEFDSPSLDAHLSQLADSLPDGLAFSTISGVEEAYVDVFVALVSDADGDAKCELDVSAKTLDRLAKLGLPIRISMTAGRE
jgi:hypothetical protein